MRDKTHASLSELAEVTGDTTFEKVSELLRKLDTCKPKKGSNATALGHEKSARELINAGFTPDDDAVVHLRNLAEMARKSTGFAQEGESTEYTFDIVRQLAELVNAELVAALVKSGGKIVGDWNYSQRQANKDALIAAGYMVATEKEAEEDE